MDVITLAPRLHFIRLPVGHAYLWRDRDGLTLVDAGLPGSAPLIADAIRLAGGQPADLRVALYLPRHGVLFTGDAAARGPDGRVICGVFNADRAQAAASFRRLAALDVAVACFGHGEPLTQGAPAEFQAALSGKTTGAPPPAG
jgi:glyoxylase-like metal-dependent hydrolase (beta-lactamase superfamily II)